MYPRFVPRLGLACTVPAWTALGYFPNEKGRLPD